MKVVFITPRPFSLVFGGLETQLMNTKKGLEALGVEVENYDPFKMDQMKDVDLVHFFGSDFTYSQIGNLLHAHRLPYVISSIFYPLSWRKLGYKILNYFPYSQSWIQRKFLQKSSKILPNSQSEQLLLEKTFKIPKAQIQVVPNGVNSNFIGKDPLEFKRKFLPEFPENIRVILSVGRIEKRKNSIRLLKSAARINAPIVFIGQPNPIEKRYTQEFFNELKQYPGLYKYIPFLSPHSNDLANAFAFSHVHALVSHLETPGLVSLEAGLNGANLVVGDSPPTKEYFKNIAWMPSPLNIAQISRNLEQSLNSKRNAMNQVSKIDTNFTWEIVCKKTLRIYLDILQRL